MNPPDWLPDMAPVSGDWDQILRELYAIFVADLKEARRQLRGRPVWWDRRILPGERYEESFWHLISRDDRSTGERLFDPRRAERLPWCGPLISHATEPEVKCWDYLEGSNRVRTYVWLESLDYAIVLERKQQRLGEVYLLITAFHVDGSSVRRSLLRKFENRQS